MNKMKHHPYVSQTDTWNRTFLDYKSGADTSSIEPFEKINEYQ